MPHSNTAMDGFVMSSQIENLDARWRPTHSVARGGRQLLAQCLVDSFQKRDLLSPSGRLLSEREKFHGRRTGVAAQHRLDVDHSASAVAEPPSAVPAGGTVAALDGAFFAGAFFTAVPALDLRAGAFFTGASPTGTAAWDGAG